MTRRARAAWFFGAVARRHTGERGLSPKGPGHPTECWTEPLPANGDPK